MRAAMACQLVLLSLVLVASGTASPQPPARQADERRAVRLHQDFEYFRAQAELQRPIDFAAIDDDLLSAAVFHETNRRRAQYSRSVLVYRAELQEAARIQARGMAGAGALSHRHPDRSLRTLADRLTHVGLHPAFSAENVAMAFGIQYEAGKPVFRRERDGRVAFSYRTGGDPIQPHTYRSFSERLLSQWMGSPGHRENILNGHPTELGTGHQHARNGQGMDVFYSVQVFYAERVRRPGARKGR